MATTEGRLYFIALRRLERLEIQYVPDEISISRTPDIAKLKVIGRNNPKHHYTGGNTTLSLKLDFYSEHESRQDVIDKCRWLESLAYSDGLSHGPDHVKLVFGRLFRNEVWAVTKVDYKLSNFSKKHGYLPQQAYVNIQLALDPLHNVRIEDVV